jgi:hypothetical protein
MSPRAAAAIATHRVGDGGFFSMILSIIAGDPSKDVPGHGARVFHSCSNDLQQIVDTGLPAGCFDLKQFVFHFET